jgi:hypothetical protein
MTQIKNNIDVATVKPEINISINDNDYRIFDFSDEMRLDGSISQLVSFMETTSGKGKSEEEKDLDYANAQSIWKGYQQDLRTVKFNFYLDRAQYNLLTDILLRKLEYDVNTVFIAIELTELLGGMSGTKFTDDKEVKSFRVDATEITYIYHLIQNYKVKGLSKDSYTFAKILRRIGEISKIVSYYDANAKSLTEEISKWALNLDSVPQIETEA